MRISAMLALVLGAMFAMPSSAAEVGTTAGEFSVSPSGSAGYSIPISVPPGIGGMAPSLSVQYDSSGSDGVLGRGASLSGLSQITRCGRNKADDGYLKGVELNDTDAFCLDGQRLVPISGADGAVGSEYRTQIDEFSKVVSYLGSPGDPQYWKVWTKSGLVMEMGNTSDSRIEAESRSTALVWAVNRMTDTTNNSITVSYFENNQNTIFLPLQIIYAGGRSVINFNYEYKSDPVFRFIAGAYTTAYHRLSKITTYANSIATREYRFGFSAPSVAGGTGRVNRLTSVTECDPRSNTCFNPTQFEWAAAPSASTTYGAAHYLSPTASDTLRDIARFGYADFNGDGRTDVYRLDSSNNTTAISIYTYRADGGQDYQQGPQVFVSSDPQQFYKDVGRVKAADFNGDGLTDFLNLNGTNVQTPATVYLKTATGFSGTPTGPSHYVSSDAKYGKFDVDRYRVVDMNGDGLPDIHVVAPGSAASTIYYNQGSGTFGNAVAGPNLYTGTANADDLSFDLSRIRYGDFNGDGLTDIYVVEGCNNDTFATVWLNSPSGFRRITSNYKHYANCGSVDGRVADMGRVMQGDFNGDGLTDMFVVNGYNGSAQSHILYSRGDGTFFLQNSLSFYVGNSVASVRLDTNRIKLADLNGDGMTDILYLDGYGSAAASKLHINRGWGAFETTSGPNYYIAGSVDQGNVDASRMTLTDTNGDGVLEMYFLGGAGTSPATELRHFPLTAGERVSRITNGLGAVIDIAYKPLTDSSIYAKGDPKTYPLMSIQGPMYVASVVSNSDGLGSVRQVEHNYTGATTDFAGRGFLGFTTHTEFDRATRIRQNTAYRQDFPFIGMPFATSAMTELNVQISEQFTTYVSKNITANGKTRYFPYVSYTTQRDYEINSPGTVARSEVVSNIYGEPDLAFFGNLTASTVETRAGREDSGLAPFKTNTVNEYDNFPSTWLLGRLKKTTVSKSVTGQPTITRTSAFEYNPTTGLLTAEVVEPLSATMMLRKSYLRDVAGNIYSTTVSGSSVTARTNGTAFDSARQFPTGMTNPLGQTTYMLHDPATGNVTRSTDINGLVTSWQFDGFGRKIKETRADGTTTSWVRTFSAGSFSVPNGVYTISTSSSDGSSAAAIYDVLERPVGTQSLAFSGSYSRTLTTYNNAGRMVTRSMPFFDNSIGCSATWTYDPVGRPKTMTSPENGGNCSGRVTQYKFGVRNSSVVDAMGNTALQEVDALGRIIRTEDGKGFKTHFGYDAYGNQTRVVDAMGNTTTIQYDLRGRKVLMDDPDMGVWSYGYNAFGELVKQTDAKGQIVTHSYDALGRMTARTEVEGNSYWWYDKDSTGLKCWTGALCESISPNGRNHKLFKYDSLGRLSTLTDTIGLVSSTGAPEVSLTTPLQIPDTPTSGPGVCPITNLSCSVERLISDTTETSANPRTLVTHYTYDGQSRVNTVKYGDEFAVGYSYNPRGYLEKLYNNQNIFLSLWTAQAHDARGNIVQHRRGNNVTTSKNFDEGTGELDAIYADGSYGVIQNLLYERDRVGNITRRTDGRLGGKYERYNYDQLNRLTTSTVSSGGTQSNSYDSIGNITYRAGVGTYRYSPDRPHAVINASNNGGPTAPHDYKFNVDFQYDANGNLLVGAGRLYTWTSYNKPEQIQRGAEGSRFEYDADRARVLEVQTRITDGLPQVTEILTSGAYERRITTNGILQDRVHISAGGELVAVLSTGPFATIIPGDDQAIPQPMYLYGDHQGNVEAVTDSSGLVIDRTSFDPFGARRMTDWSADPDYTESKRSHPTDRGYTGHHQPDHLQLIHMNGRVYDPYLARFISADPYIQDPTNSQSLNRYSYVWNNPINGTDPSGYFLKSFYKSVKNFLQDARRSIYSAAACAGGAAATGGSPAGCAAAVGAYNAYAVKDSGGSTSQALRTGVITGVTAYATQSIRIGLPATSPQAVVASGFVQGTSSVLQGGNFYQGFATGAINSAVPLPNNPIGAILVSAAVGGTTSVISGGKFTNGAINAAYFYALGEIADRSLLEIQSLNSPSSKGTPSQFSFTGEEITIAGGTRGIFSEETAQCRSSCLNERYGSLYEFSSDLNPLSIDGLIIGQLVDEADFRASRSISQNSYGESRNLPLGRSSLIASRQASALSALRIVNAGVTVLGAAAFGFQLGAYGYCTVDCIK